MPVTWFVQVAHNIKHILSCCHFHHCCGWHNASVKLIFEFEFFFDSTSTRINATHHFQVPPSPPSACEPYVWHAATCAVYRYRVGGRHSDVEEFVRKGRKTHMKCCRHFTGVYIGHVHVWLACAVYQYRLGGVTQTWRKSCRHVTGVYIGHVHVWLVLTPQ